MAKEKPKRRVFKANNELKPVKKKKLYEDIVSQIYDLIDKERLKFGDQIPPERELAEIFQVSRNSVREAIRTLEEKQILRSRPGDGTYVVVERESLMVEILATAIHEEKNRLSEIFQFRRLIEPEIAFLAAKNGSVSDIEEAERILQEQSKDLKDGKETINLDSSFHLLLARMSGNKILLRTVQIFNDILGETRSEYSQSEQRRLTSLEGHTALIEAIKQRKPGLARQAMGKHLKHIEMVVLSQKGDSEAGVADLIA